MNILHSTVTSGQSFRASQHPALFDAALLDPNCCVFCRGLIWQNYSEKETFQWKVLINRDAAFQELIRVMIADYYCRCIYFPRSDSLMVGDRGNILGVLLLEYDITSTASQRIRRCRKVCEQLLPCQVNWVQGGQDVTRAQGVIYK